jgi:hypothetical protein
MRTKHTIERFGLSPQAYDLFSALSAAHNARKAGNADWVNTHEDRIYSLLEHFLPHGSGINCDWKYDLEMPHRIICSNSYHCMNENGYYDGWIDFTVTIKPDLSILIKGKFGAHQDIADYLHETIDCALSDMKHIQEVLCCITYHQTLMSEIFTALPTVVLEPFTFELPALGIKHTVDPKQG